MTTTGYVSEKRKTNLMAISNYMTATEQIKEAILSSQYKAAKQVNAVQLSLYYGVGRYVSQNTRKGVWGTGAIKAISEQLHKELPGLRGFSPSAIKNMRAFYEAWQELDINSPTAVGELEIKYNYSLSYTKSNKKIFSRIL